MTTVVVLLLAWGAPPPSALAAAEPLPPDPYTLDGVVTDDMSDEWIATREIPLFASPGSRKLIATVAPGEVMHAEALQLRGRPWEVRVLHDYGPLRAGMRLWILARDMDEGHFILWYRGETRTDLDVGIDFGLIGKRADAGRRSAGCGSRRSRRRSTGCVCERRAGSSDGCCGGPQHAGPQATRPVPRPQEAPARRRLRSRAPQVRDLIRQRSVG